MNNTTTAQNEAIAKLEKQGFRFSNWIQSDENHDSQGEIDTMTAVLIRKPNKYTREYRQVEPNGTIN